MQKKILFVFLFIFSIALNAQNYNEDPILSIGFDSQKIDEKILNADVVRNKFEKIFREHTVLIIYDTANESQIFKYQNISGVTGSLEIASAVAFIELQKVGTNVSLTLKITNAGSGAIIASTHYNIPEADVYNMEKFDAAIGAVSVDIMHSLDIPLSESAIQSLKGQISAKDISSMDIKIDIEEKNKQLERIKEKISLLKNKGTDSITISKINGLQIQHDKLLKKQETEKKRLERKLQDEERAREEAKIAADREEEQNKIIQSQSKKYEQYAKRQRNLSLQSMNSLQQIEVVEKNKQAILSMRKDKELNINAFREHELTNADKDCKKIDDEPYSLIDKDALGQPTSKAISERRAKKKKIMEDANTRIFEYEKQVQKNHKVFEYNLLSEIKQNYKIIRKKASVNSIDNPEVLRLRIENYDGNLFGWYASITFDFDTTNIANYSILIPYKKLFNKKPDYSSVNYRNTVEEYDSYFRSNIPVIYAVVDYYIEPLSSDQPSKYVVKILKTSLYKIELESDKPTKKFLSKKEKNLEGYYEADIISDIRTEAEKKEDEQKTIKAAQKQIEKEKRATRKKEQKAIRRKKSPEAARNFFTPARYSGFNIGMQTSRFDFDTSRFYANIDFPIWPFFIGAETTLWQSEMVNNGKKSIENVFAEWYNLNMNYGLELGLHFTGFKGWFSPYIFGSGGANYDFATSNISGYVNGTLGFHFLSIFGINYSCEYNINKKTIKHLFGVSIGINIIKKK